MSDIPQRKLGDLCTVSSSKRIYAHEYVENGVPFYRSKEIIQKHNGDEINTELFITEERYVEIKEKFGAPSNGDMLMTSVGTLGVPYIVQPAEKFYFKDGNLTWYKDFSDELDSKYLFYLMDSEDGKELIKTVTIGSSQAALTIDGMKGLMIPCPTKEHQKKIVKILIAYDDLIENNNRRIAILEEMAQRLYREWFVHFRFPGHEDVEMVESELGMIPEGWQAGKVGDICDRIFSGGTPTTTINEYWNGDFPWLSSGETRNSFIVDTEKSITKLGVDNSSTRKANANDVVIASAGQGKTRGQTSYLLIDTYINQSVIALRGKENVSEYLFINIKSRYPELRNASDSSSIRGSITTVLMSGLDIIIPNGEVLREFSGKVSLIIKHIAVLQRKNNTLRKTRDHLLPRLISGDIDVSNIDIPV